VFSPDTWRDQLKGAVGVISTLGAFGSNDFMYRFVVSVGASSQAASGRLGQPNTWDAREPRMLDFS